MIYTFIIVNYFFFPETIEALKRARKASTNLSRTFLEAHIGSLVDSSISNKLITSKDFQNLNV